MNYQAVEPQAVDPPTAAARINAATSLLMKTLLTRGTNGKSGYTPFEGWMQAFTLLKSSHEWPVLTPIAVWTASLALSAVVMAVGLALAGWALPNPLIIAGLGA